MNKEYLEDYEKKEKDQYRRLVLEKISEAKFEFDKDKYPPKERFKNLQEPVVSTTLSTQRESVFWSQVPFSGSLVFLLLPYSKERFEQIYLRESQIAKLIDFVKETGRVQVVLGANPTDFEGLDYLDPFFIELEPSVAYRIPIEFFGEKQEIENARVAYETITSPFYVDFLDMASRHVGFKPEVAYRLQRYDYEILKLGKFAVAEELENLMMDSNPENLLKAHVFSGICAKFITSPISDLLSDTKNFTLADIKSSEDLPKTYQPKDIRFPSEIGEFLTRRLTRAPKGLRACYDMLDEYDNYDLRKLMQALNDAIVHNRPDAIPESVNAINEVLDNVWEDPTISRRVKTYKYGIPLSIAALGGIAGALTFGLGGFLTSFGFALGEKILDEKLVGLSERLAKVHAKSHQVNIYDFKEKYENRLVNQKKN